MSELAPICPLVGFQDLWSLRWQRKPSILCLLFHQTCWFLRGFPNTQNQGFFDSDFFFPITSLCVLSWNLLISLRFSKYPKPMVLWFRLFLSNYFFVCSFMELVDFFEVFQIPKTNGSLIPTFSFQVLDTHGYSNSKRNILNPMCEQRYIRINSHRIVSLTLGLVAISLLRWLFPS